MWGSIHIGSSIDQVYGKGGSQNSWGELSITRLGERGKHKKKRPWGGGATGGGGGFWGGVEGVGLADKRHQFKKNWGPSETRKHGKVVGLLTLVSFKFFCGFLCGFLGCGGFFGVGFFVVFGLCFGGFFIFFFFLFGKLICCVVCSLVVLYSVGFFMWCLCKTEKTWRYVALVVGYQEVGGGHMGGVGLLRDANMGPSLVQGPKRQPYTGS